MSRHKPHLDRTFWQGAATYAGRLLVLPILFGLWLLILGWWNCFAIACQVGGLEP